MPASSSYHSFNMDRPRPAGSIRLWMAVNHLLHRLDGARGPGRLETSRFRPEWDEAFWSAMQPGLSPSRAWCNWFWSGLPWKGIRRALGRLDVLDLGCGSGAYARQWDAWSGGLDRYTGVDFTARDAWTGVNAGPGRTFHASDIIRYVQANPVSATLLLSQSALEHFPEDTRLMNLLRDRVMTAGGPRLQVHLVPSAACLALPRTRRAPVHAAQRRETAGRISRHRRALPAGRTGGAAGNRVHHEWITAPVLAGRGDRRATEPEGYQAALKRAMREDLEGDGGDPCFWAVVIQTGGTVPEVDEAWRA
ncbi:MAG: class I SAM-dependent methyltransferase [Kiritimatiellia bacterium]